MKLIDGYLNKPIEEENMENRRKCLDIAHGWLQNATKTKVFRI